MPGAEEYYEEKVRGSAFREPQLSSLTSSYEGESGREFLIHGQRTLHMLTSDPCMGGSLYQLDDHRGRVGIVHTEDETETYAYIELMDREEDVCIEELVSADEALTFLDDAEACGKFLMDRLRQMNLTFWNF